MTPHAPADRAEPGCSPDGSRTRIPSADCKKDGLGLLPATGWQGPKPRRGAQVFHAAPAEHGSPCPQTRWSCLPGRKSTKGQNSAQLGNQFADAVSPRREVAARGIYMRDDLNVGHPGTAGMP